MSPERRAEILRRYGFGGVVAVEETAMHRGFDRGWEREDRSRGAKAPAGTVPPPARPPVEVVVRPLFDELGGLALDRDTEAA